MASDTHDLDGYFRRLGAYHQQLCPRQVLGVRMGLYAARLLGLDVAPDSKRAFAIVETDGCFADAVSQVSGCWLGKRRLRLFDYGKVAVTLVDVHTEQAVRVCPHPLARAGAADFAPSAATRWHAQLEGYQRMPIDELVCAESVRLTLPLSDFIVQRSDRLDCSNCGEEVNTARLMTVRGRLLCRACATDGYYIAYRDQGVSWTAEAA
jgi:formylmethanofuran dehydrogenase subunit E